MGDKKIVFNIIGSRRIISDLRRLEKKKRKSAEACYRVMDEKRGVVDKAYWAAKGNADMDIADELAAFTDSYRIL